jgi:hypothetical protein
MVDDEKIKDEPSVKEEPKEASTLGFYANAARSSLDKLIEQNEELSGKIESLIASNERLRVSYSADTKLGANQRLREEIGDLERRNKRQYDIIH